MPESVLPDELRRFILLAIPSVPYLEAVLLLRAAPEADWDAATVARRLYLPEPAAADLLAQLRANGVAAGEHGLRYAPASPELAAMLERVAAAYATHLIDVSQLIHARLDKQAQQFAGAFVWRKES